MKPPIVNLEDVPVTKLSHGDRFEFEVAWAANTLNARKLGFNVTVIPPGKRAWPYHRHHLNDEMFFVLEGEGSIRIDGAVHRIRKGDFISLPAGPGSAHQIVNDSKAPLRYLAVSTMEPAEIAEYPDAGKLGLFTGSAPGQPPPEGALRLFLRAGQPVDYWDGEE